jgi:broad specificity phosphatase PhoE
MRLIIVRHGESQSNVHQGKAKNPADTNSKLTELGEHQAIKLADWMKTKIKHVDLLYASSLTRALQTAKPIARAYNQKIIPEHRLREGGFNYSDGIPIPDDLLPIGNWIDWHAKPFEPFDPTVEGIETYAQLKDRSASFLDQLIENHLGKTIVAITHAWTSNALYDVIFNSCPYRQCHIHFWNTAVSFFEYNPDWKLGPWYAHFLAQTPHIDLFPNGIE